MPSDLSSFSIFPLLLLCVCSVHAICAYMLQGVQRSEDSCKVSLLPSLLGFQGLNSGCQTSKAK